MIPLAPLRLLLYPLGLLASFLFGTRTLWQWLRSEKAKKSMVTKGFWRLSLAAHVVMVVHAFIQNQYPLCLIQTLNGIIAWRNLDLMGSTKRSWKFPVFLMTFTSFSLTFLFVLQGAFLSLDDWMRVPTALSAHPLSFSWGWHAFGIFGMILFSFRFWLQWWAAEQQRTSHLGKGFWWTSLIGASICVTYFASLRDTVNLISYATGIIPYLRNLILLKRTSPSLPPSPSLFIFAGEQSGDLLGGSLIQTLREHSPHLSFWGVGGKEMEAAGLQSILPLHHFHVMGFSDVFKALPRLFKALRTLKKAILTENPAAVICIDSPDFTMRLEKALRRAGYQGKLIHYVSPTVWAWRKNRVHTLAKTLDLLLVLFPFEKECYAGTSLPVISVGHPLVKATTDFPYDLHWRSRHHIPQKAPLLALFPGSRSHEIADNLPAQLQAAADFLSSYPDVHCALSVARPDLLPQIHAIIEKSPLKPTLIDASDRYALMHDATLALATSGTVTLELALFETPTIVHYQINLLNYLLGRYVFRIILPHYCLVNILARKEVFPEFYTRSLHPTPLTQALQKLYQKNALATCRTLCSELRTSLGSHDPNLLAAHSILHLLTPVYAT